jgi:hypothetical protein
MANENTELALTMPAGELGVLTGSLVKQSYERVAGLVEKIRSQVQGQIDPKGDEKQEATFRLTVGETNFCLQAMAELPYKVVAVAIEHLQTQGSKAFAELEQQAAVEPAGHPADELVTG